LLLLKGAPVAKEITLKVKQKISSLETTPCLATVQVGEDPASLSYLKVKDKKCQEVGINTVTKQLPSDSTREDVVEAIDSLNRDNSVQGILLNVPLPKHLKMRELIEFIYPGKDVDGLHPLNLGRLSSGSPSIAPATPVAVIELLRHYHIPLVGRETTIIGRSVTVGKTLAMLLLRENATVTVCHTKTRELSEHTKASELVVAAAGSPGLLKAEMIQNGAIVVDVGTNVVEGKMVGDVDFENVKEKCYAVSPVPGGVGPVTVAVLLRNFLECVEGGME
jgi:methylenetetrahydrofolate dehydrogenase (NADP+)/methenyltetrahydrofolate cyclohydrolase